MKKETPIMAVILVMSTYFGIIDYENTSHFNISVVALFACSVLYFMITLFERKKMFNWFKRPKYQYPTWADIPTLTPLQDIKEYPNMQPIPNPHSYTNDGYTVGVDNSGNTIIRVMCNNTTTTLTLNHGSVRQMIRLLEATMQEDDEETVPSV